MSLMRKVEALRPPIPSFSRSSDLESVSKLLDKYASILGDNAKAIDELCAIADNLHVDHNQLVQEMKDSEQPSSSNDNDDNDNYNDNDNAINDNLEDLENSLNKQIDELKVQVARRRHRTALTTKLLELNVHGMDKCASALRDIAYQRSMQALEIHKKYLPLVEAKQNEYMDLVNSYNETENQVFRYSRDISQALRSLSAYEAQVIASPRPTSVTGPVTEN